jgi:hypothetical protein
LLGGGEIVGRHGNLEAETGLPIDGEGVGVRLDLIAADRHVLAGDTGGVERIHERGIEGGVFTGPEQD